MKGLPKFKEEYFTRFAEKPVKIIPFNPKTKEKALKYKKDLYELLKEWQVEIEIHGSTELEIAGKGEIEIAVYPKKGDWFDILIFLINHFKMIGNLRKDYARFNTIFENEEIEIIVTKGKSAEVNRKLQQYLKENKSILKEYENLKYKHAHSKREYYIQKDKFFRKVIEQIPE